MSYPPKPEQFHHPLTDFLDAKVPLLILHYIRRGGPTAFDYAKSRDYWQQRVEKGGLHELLYLEPGTTAKTASHLANILACLSFVPGGVKIFGRHWIGTVPKQKAQS